MRIDYPEVRLGHGKMELLERIEHTGSISAAGRSMDMSYRRAWLLVEAMNAMFDEPVVASQRGGSKGGGAAVTEFGRALLARYRLMEKKLATALADDLEWLDAHRPAAGTRPTGPISEP